MPPLSIAELRARREAAREERNSGEAGHRVMACCATGCCSVSAMAIKAALEQEVEKQGLRDDIRVIASGCNGFCGQGPVAVIWPEGYFYTHLTIRDVAPLISEHFKHNQPLARLMYRDPVSGDPIPYLSDIPFFEAQKLVVLRNKDIINPEVLDYYLARDGYLALEKVLSEMTPRQVIEEIIASGLRGRGGTGFPTGLKWKICSEEKKTPRYIIGNCDEGDPGAFMDRTLLESDPRAVIEGMLIAAYAIGAFRGYMYIRTEYPLAIIRMQTALFQVQEAGLLGENILGTGFNFQIEIREGSGAFVCGEETALIRSIEGEIPEPRQRPPYPAQVGIWGCPTVINDVETLANVPTIIRQSASWYSGIGTETSKGTKIFSLVGKINNTGLIEVPMGIRLREIIYDIGGGIPENKRLKAVQTGGPSGGCIPAECLDLPIDFESLKSVGSMMGSGGMIVMDEDTCMVDVARYFIQFTNDESCGKCSICRDGSAALLEVLTRITDGEGREGDLEFLEELSLAIKDGSMCGLGTTLPNPVLSTLKYFRDEYEAHIRYKQCPAVVCRGIISSPCQYSCPLKTDVPAYLSLIAREQFEAALKVIRQTNPLPIICGRVCMAHCEAKCRAREAGGALAIRNLKRFLTDYELRTAGRPGYAERPTQRFSERVAIIGSGPAGLTAAFYLAQQGYPVTVFEKLPVAGGLLAVGIPEFRLPKKYVQMEIEGIQQLGVDIRTNSEVKDIDALFANGFQAVLISVGAHKNRKLGIPGEEATGVLDPIRFLSQVNLGETPSLPGERVGVVGGGNTAIDVARTALRLGCPEVRILYRRTRAEMPAIEEEIEAALEEGIYIDYLVAPTRIIAPNGVLQGVELIRMQLGEPDASGRRRPLPIEGSEFILKLDTLIPAISQEPDLSFIPEGSGIELTENHTIKVDPHTFATSRPGVFACGDAALGPSDITTAMATAKIAAQSIHQFLRGEEIKQTYRTVSPTVLIEPVK